MSDKLCCKTSNRCCGCGRQIQDHHLRHVTLDGRKWHELCWQRECNNYYQEQTLDDGAHQDE